MGLTKLAITRPVFMLMLMLTAIIMGISSYSQMRVEQNPEVQFGVLTISTVYPGAGPEEINTLVSRKIEDSISGVNGLRELTSTSQEGVSVVVANFNLGTDMDTALNDVRSKVDTVVGQLPTGIERPIVNKLDSATEPVMTIAVKSERMGKRELRDLIDDRVKDRFAQIPGVANVDVSGGEIRELQVRLKADRLVAYKLGIVQVQRAVQAATLNVPSGRIVKDGVETTVRVLGEFKTVADLQNTILSVSDPNNPMGASQILRLKDIADVEDATQERLRYSRLDGNDAVTLNIRKIREGNAIEVANASKALFEPLEKQYGLKFEITQNQATYIRESIDDLIFALAFGITLVALIVYIFLHNLRGTLIVGIAIPVCIFAAVIAMKAMGFTINNLSMLGLSLAVGVLVDDAIVVLENIFRHLQKGEDPREAAINGRSEIGLAAIAITMADIVVFVPIGFMGGIVGQFYRPLALGFAACVAISLFVSFTITPMLASRWYRKGEDVEHFDKGFAGWFERVFHRFQDHYRRVLTWSLHHRWFVFTLGNLALIAVFMLLGGSFQKTAADAFKVGFPGPFGMAVFVGLLVALYWGWRGAKNSLPADLTGFFPRFLGTLVRFPFKIRPKFILFGALFGLIFPAAALFGFAWGKWKGGPLFNFAFLPPSDAGRIAISIELPPGSSLEATTRVVEEVENRVKTHPDAEFVVAEVGAGATSFAGMGTGSSTNLANITVTLLEKKAIMDSILFFKKHEKPLRLKDHTVVAAEMTKMVLDPPIPGARITVTASSGFGFGSPIQMSFTGENRAQLTATVDNIRRKLAANAIPGVITPDISAKPGKPEVRAIPDRERLADYGLTVADLAGTMRVLYEGNKDAKFRVAGREYNIRVMLDLAERNDPATLSRLPISFYRGNPVYVTDLAKLTDGEGVTKIERRDRTEEVKLTADLLPGYAAGNAQAQITKWLEDEKLVPEGVKIKPLGQADAQAREGVYLFSALAVGFFLVYVLLAILYENLVYPFIIQLAQPQAMVGVLLALAVTDKTFNIIGFIGVIALVGLVGKNAILLVDYTNTLRERGKQREEAILEAGPTRLRPIMMTTLALILGTLPVALAIGRGSEFRETIGIAIIGGIALSTFLTLLVIPCSYTIFDDLSVAIGNWRRGLYERKGWTGKED